LSADAGAADGDTSARDITVRFHREVLKGRTCPADLAVLLRVQLERETGGVGPDPFGEVGVELLMPGELPSLLSHDYLTDAERVDPGIVANIVAIDAVVGFCTFVAKADNGELLGYWHGPENTSIEQSPIVEFDTEVSRDARTTARRGGVVESRLRR
jgi:hypothetical protein